MKYYSLLFAFSLITSFASAQDSTEPKPAFKDRIYYGGGLGLSFGTVTSVNVNPLIGYKVTDKLSAGITIQYQYFKRKDDFFDYESNSYGGSVFARYRFIPELYGHVEYANVNYDFFSNSGEQLYRRWVPFLYVGGGYTAQIGQRSVFYVQVLFDILNDPYSPYDSGQPIWSAGVGIGF